MAAFKQHDNWSSRLTFLMAAIGAEFAALQADALQMTAWHGGVMLLMPLL